MIDFFLVTHLSSQDYEICFRRNAGNCFLCFSPTVIVTTPAVIAQVDFADIALIITNWMISFSTERTLFCSFQPDNWHHYIDTTKGFLKDIISTKSDKGMLEAPEVIT
jgi:hypothetical protein